MSCSVCACVIFYMCVLVTKVHVWKELKQLKTLFAKTTPSLNHVFYCVIMFLLRFIVLVF